MNHKSIVCIVSTWVVATVCPLSAVPPETGQDPAEILRLTREVPIAGRHVELAAVHAARSSALADAEWPRITLALQSLTGPREVWFLTGYDSMATWGDKDKAALEAAEPELKSELEQLVQQEEALLVSKRELKLSFEKKLSYRPKFDWSEIRCVSIRTWIVPKVTRDKFKKWCELVVESHTRLNIDEHILVYSAGAGQPVPVFVTIIPYKSFKDMEAINDAHPPGEDSPEMIELARIASSSEEQQYFCFDPKASHVTAAWAGSNRSFWLADDEDTARASVPEVRLTDFPAPVQRAMQEQSRDYTNFTLATRKSETGATQYGIEMTKHGLSKEVVITGDGQVVMVEEQVPLDTLPPAPRAAIQASIGKGKLLHAERVTKNGATIYQGIISRSHKFHADGQSLSMAEVPISDTETKIETEDLPLAVFQAVQALREQNRGSIWREMSIRNGDVPMIEVALKKNGRTKEVIFDMKGNVVVVEEQIPLEAIPGGARAAIQKSVGAGTLLKVEQSTRNGATSYAAKISSKVIFDEKGVSLATN